MVLRRKTWVALVLSGLLCAGCWDRREIEERATVLASGVDLCEEGQGCALIVTRQIAIPGRIPLGGAEGSRGGGTETVFVLSSPGKDGPDSGARAQAVLNRRISFGHMRLLIFSEEYSRKGLNQYLDYARRHPELRRLAWIAVVEGRAEDVLRAVPELDPVPALFLNDLIDDAVRTGRLPEVFIGEFLTRMSNKGEDTVAPLIRMAGTNRPALAGMAVFRGDRMVGKLSHAETMTHMELRGSRRGSELLEVNVGDRKSAVLRVFGRRVRYRVSTEAGRIQATVEIELESDLLQSSPGFNSADPQAFAVVEQRAAEQVVRRSAALVRRYQTEFGTDALGLGEHVRAYLPAVWRSIPDWSEAFPKVRFTFDVKVRVRRDGMATE